MSRKNGCNKKCKVCKKEFYITEYNKNKIFCSKKCHIIAQKGIHYSPKTEFKKGSKHILWKNGKIKTSLGYIKVYKPNHPFCDCQGYVYEHRLVMEKHLGRVLKPEKIIHHIDKNPSNNRIKNLRIFISNYEHLTFHKII